MPRWSTSRYLPAVAVVAAFGLFAASPALAGADRISSDGELARFSPAVPPRAAARVDAVYDANGDSTITLWVTGLRPTTEYGAHAHVHACGTTPRSAGPDFQMTPNPNLEAPHDPAFENPVNEVWLDFETDESGNGVATTTVPWQFSPERRAGSVIIHAEHTHVGPDGPPGTAGARLACLSVGF